MHSCFVRILILLRPREFREILYYEYPNGTQKKEWAQIKSALGTSILLLLGGHKAS